MPQDQESGRRANIYGRRTAKKIAKQLNGKKVAGRENSNEYEIDNRKVVIKTAKVKTTKVGVSYLMLKRIDAILGSFETENGTYDIYELSPDVFCEHMTPTGSQGPSSGKVGMVSKSVFLNQGKFVRELQID